MSASGWSLYRHFITFSLRVTPDHGRFTATGISHGEKAKLFRVLQGFSCLGPLRNKARTTNTMLIMKLAVLSCVFSHKQTDTN
jgi:hypothetical protein